jgi:cytoskeletal protein CcmA (bactofilin family)
MMNKDVAQRRKTLIEEGTQFKGAISSDCPIEVKGRIDGEVTAPSLLVSATGAVHGHVKVGEMRSEGELAGEFDVDIVQLSGTVKDNTVIRAKSLEVKLAPANGKLQVIFGACELEVGTDQSQKKESAARPADIPRPVTVHPPVSDGGPAKAGNVPPVADANGAE